MCDETSFAWLKIPPAEINSSIKQMLKSHQKYKAVAGSVRMILAGNKKAGKEGLDVLFLFKLQKTTITHLYHQS